MSTEARTRAQSRNSQSPSESSFDSQSHSHFTGVGYRTGPSAGRDSECGICLDEMQKTDKTLIHAACQNTFHEDCLSEAILFEYQSDDSDGLYHRLDAASRCPMCRSRIFFIWPQYESSQQLAHWHRRENFHALQDAQLQVKSVRLMGRVGAILFSEYWEKTKLVLFALPSSSYARYESGILLLRAADYAYSPGCMQRNVDLIDRLELRSTTDIYTLTASHSLTLFVIEAKKLIRLLKRNIQQGRPGTPSMGRFRFLADAESCAEFMRCL